MDGIVLNAEQVSSWMNRDFVSSLAYNMAGQRVNANAKGLVIVNGKKTMRK